MKFYKTSMAMIVFFHAAIGIFIYMYFIDPIGAVRYTNLPFPTDKVSYKSGEIVGINRSVCRREEYKFDVSASIVDGFSVGYPTISGVGGKGCTTKIGLEFKIPDFFPPGEYRIQGITSFHINPLRSVDIKWQTVPFTVLQ